MMDLNQLEERIAHSESECLVMGMLPSDMRELAALIRRQEAELAEARATIQRMTAAAYDEAEKVDRLEEARASLPAAGAVLTDSQIEAALDAFNQFPCPNPGSIARSSNREQMAAAILAAQPAAAAPDAQPLYQAKGPDASGWEDVDFATFTKASVNGYDTRVSYTSPPAPAAQPEAKAAPAQAPLQANAGPSHGDMPVDRFIKAMPLPQYLSAAAPAMGEELPQLPNAVDEIAEADGFNVIGRQEVFTADQMHAYGRACMALRQPGADLLAKMVAAPVAVSSKAEDGSVPVPTNANMAKMMVLLGSNWLVANAPDQIATSPVSQPADRAAQERDMLAKGIGDALLKAQIWNGEVPLSGPHLLMMLNDLAELVSQPAAQETFGYVSSHVGDAVKGQTRYTAEIRARQSAGFPVALYTAPQPLSAPAGSEQEKNAARYLELRDHHHMDDFGDGWLYLRFECGGKYPSMTEAERGAAIDAAIDAALAAQQEGGAA